MEEFYKSFSKGPVFHTTPETAELSKLANNAFLSLKVSFINEISQLCELYKGNMKDLSLILGLDHRISKHFLNPGLGFGGYCLPKDLQLLLEQGFQKGQQMKILKAVQEVNAARPFPLF